MYRPIAIVFVVAIATSPSAAALIPEDLVDPYGAVRPLLPANYFVGTATRSPESVYGGSTFAVSVTLSTTSTTGSLISVNPAVGGGSACELISFSVSGGYETPDGRYFLPPRDDHDKLDRALRSLGVPDDVMEVMLASEIKVDLRVSTEDGNYGQCKVGTSVTEVYPQLVPSAPNLALDVIDVIPAPPWPIDMGALKAVGGPIAQDQVVQAAKPALSEVTVLTVVSKPILLAVGSASYVDGGSWQDSAYFTMSIDKGRVLALQDEMVGDPGPPVVVAAEFEVDPGINGAAKEYEVCFSGQYIDGGLYTDHEGHYTQCVAAFVKKVSGEEIGGLTLGWLEEDPVLGPLLQRFGYVLLPLPPDQALGARNAWMFVDWAAIHLYP